MNFKVTLPFHIMRQAYAAFEKRPPWPLQPYFEAINYPAASGRSMKRKILTLSPSPYPSPQGEGTSGNPTASGWGIKNIIKCYNYFSFNRQPIIQAE
jgi:hypothetical protein